MVSYSCAQMFALVNDIESYPQFMPGCAGAQILNSGEDWLEARLDLAKMGMRQSFSTRNTLRPPESMTLSLLDGPFSQLEGEWRFVALSETACKVCFSLDFNVSNRLMAMALGKLMEQVAGEQVDAICRRAKAIYA